MSFDIEDASRNIVFSSTLSPYWAMCLHCFCYSSEGSEATGNHLQLLGARKLIVLLRLDVGHHVRVCKSEHINQVRCMVKLFSPICQKGRYVVEHVCWVYKLVTSNKITWSQISCIT